MALCASRSTARAVVLVGERVGVFGFEIGGPGRRVIRAVDIQKRLPDAYEISGRHQDVAHRPADCGEHRRGGESIIGDGSGKPQYSREAAFRHRCDLHVRHLVDWEV